MKVKTKYYLHVDPDLYLRRGRSVLDVVVPEATSDRDVAWKLSEEKEEQ